MAHSADDDTGGAPLAGAPDYGAPTSGVGDAPDNSDLPFGADDYGGDYPDDAGLNN